MKNKIAFILLIATLLTGCSQQKDNENSIVVDTLEVENKVEVNQTDKIETTEEIENNTQEINNDTTTSVETEELIAETQEIPVDTEETEETEEAEETELVDNSFAFDISFTGDVMIASFKGQVWDGSFSDYANTKEPSYFFEDVKSYFESDDYTMVNLENVLTDNPLVEVGKNHNPAYWYKAPTKYAEILTSSSIETVSLSNNHTGDYGTQGALDTQEALKNHNILYGSDSEVLYLEKNGYKVAIICCGLWSQWNTSYIINRLTEASNNSDFQVIFYHGGTERVHTPEDWRVKASHDLVDAGADLVLGGHPHVLQPMEEYNGVRIIHSLGNFCFGGGSNEENRTIIYKLRLNITDQELNTIEEEIIPCYVYKPGEKWKPAPIIDESERQKVIDFMNGKIDSPI